MGKKAVLLYSDRFAERIYYAGFTKNRSSMGRRQPDNSWKFEILNASSDVLFIESIGTSLKLTEIYSNVKFR